MILEADTSADLTTTNGTNAAGGQESFSNKEMQTD